VNYDSNAVEVKSVGLFLQCLKCSKEPSNLTRILFYYGSNVGEVRLGSNSNFYL